MMNIEDLENRCKYWRNLLGLGYWDIKVEMTKGVRAVHSLSVSSGKAIIRIETPKEDNGYSLSDAEQNLVHELLFIVLAHSTGENNILYEQALYRIAHVLVYLSRALENFASIRQA